MLVSLVLLWSSSLPLKLVILIGVSYVCWMFLVLLRWRAAGLVPCLAQEVVRSLALAPIWDAVVRAKRSTTLLFENASQKLTKSLQNLGKIVSENVAKAWIKPSQNIISIWPTFGQIPDQNLARCFGQKKKLARPQNHEGKLGNLPPPDFPTPLRTEV